MKAQHRCKKHSQGDKCRLELQHTGDHLGQFTRWNGQVRVELAKRRAPKRDRTVNRFVNSVKRADVAKLPSSDRNRYSKLLMQALKHLRG